MVIWFFSCAITLPTYFVMNQNSTSTYACDAKQFHQENLIMLILRISILMITFPIPLLIVTILYYYVIKKIMKVSESLVTDHQRQIHATKMMIVATTFFMFSNTIVAFNWFFLGSFRSSLTSLLDNNRAIVLWITISYIIFILAAIQNPIIFFVYNKTFRKAVIALLKWKKIVPDHQN